MVIEACRTVLTERCRLMCKQRGRQHQGGVRRGGAPLRQSLIGGHASAPLWRGLPELTIFPARPFTTPRRPLTADRHLTDGVDRILDRVSDLYEVSPSERLEPTPTDRREASGMLINRRGNTANPVNN